MSIKGKIFFTGQRGFIGTHLINALTSRLDKNNLFDGYRLTEEHYVASRENDIIIHLSAITHTRQEFDPLLIKKNYILANNIFLSKARVIYASSCSAKYDTSPYAQSKMWSEHLGNNHGNALGLRFFNVYGSGNQKGIVNYLMQQPNGAKITIRGGELLRDYVFIENIIDEIIYQISPEYYFDNNTRNGDQKYERRLDYYAAYKSISGGQFVGVKEVGTGVATKTIDLVSLYSELSGKIFDVECIDPLPSDPECMVAARGICDTTLRQGLLKTINQQ